MATTMPAPVQMRVDAMPEYHAALITVLNESGLDAREIGEVIAQNVSAECVSCGIRLTGEEIGQIRSAQAEGEAPESKVGRLRQGYCARKDCDSYFYRMSFTEHPKVDWMQTVERVAAVLSRTPSQRVDADSVVPPPKPGRDPRVVRVVVGLIIVLLLIILRQFMTGGALPLIHKPPEYRVDPASVETTPKP